MSRSDFRGPQAGRTLSVALALALRGRRSGRHRRRARRQCAAADQAAPGRRSNARAAAAEFGAANLWWGRFAGRRETLFEMFNTTSQWACFRTETDCRNWLYWMNSEWQDWQWVSRCDKGYTP